MNIPTPPWYKPLNDKLKGVEWLVDLLLVAIIVICVVLLIRGKPLEKTAALIYLISP